MGLARAAPHPPRYLSLARLVSALQDPLPEHLHVLDQLTKRRVRSVSVTIDIVTQLIEIETLNRALDTAINALPEQ